MAYIWVAMSTGDDNILSFLPQLYKKVFQSYIHYYNIK